MVDRKKKIKDQSKYIQLPYESKVTNTPYREAFDDFKLHSPHIHKRWNVNSKKKTFCNDVWLGWLGSNLVEVFCVEVDKI